MRRRPAIALGMAAGALWAPVPLWLGAHWETDLPLAAASVAPGLVLAAMIGRLAQRRFFEDALIDGQPTTGAAEIDRCVLQNTAEQIVLALCLWPAAALAGGPGVAMALGLSFTLMRALFWAGYHLSPPLRALGFAGTFYPTALAGLWAAWHLATR